MGRSKFENVEALSSEDLKEIDELFAQTLRDETTGQDESASDAIEHSENNENAVKAH